MNNKYGPTKERLVAALPVALQRDPSVVALAEAVAEALAMRPIEIDRLRIYSQIDLLDEPLLDILAHDYKVDWWDADYTIDEKRRTLKDSWRVHKLLGTKAAVETAISAIYPRTTVQEWFEYGGKPYHFRLNINITNDSIDSAKQRRVLERLNFYKSLRSHNDGVTYFVEAAPAIAKAVSVAAGLTETTHVPLVVPVPIIRPAICARTGAITGLWESAAVRLDIPTPTIRPEVKARAGVTTGLREVFAAAVDIPTPAIRPKIKARVGVATGLWEVFGAAIDIPIPTIQRPVVARARALAGLGETFVARITLPKVKPPTNAAKLRTAVSGAWQECYTSGATLMDRELTATTQAGAKGAVTSAQEVAKTYINLQEVDYGRGN